MASRQITLPDDLYVKIVELNKKRKEAFSATIVYLCEKGLQND